MKTLRDEDLGGALAGDEAAQARLVERLTPVIQHCVGSLLWSVETGRDPRSLVEDLTQEIFILLFRDNAKSLRAWNPDLGSSLENFVGMIAARRGRSMLRGRHVSSSREWPTEDEDLERPTSDADPEVRTASREELELVLDRFENDLSPDAWQVFELLFVEECSIEEVCQITGLSREVIYQRKSRLMKKARELLEEL